MHDTKSLFGPDSAQFIEIIDQLALAKSTASYSFMAADDYERVLREDSGLGMQVYWNEILARAHLTAVVAVLRSRHWISAVVAATNDKNLLAFAAALRGLIESSADTQSALGAIAISLAENHAQISSALSGTPGSQCCVSKEIEDTLIHFKYARHLTKAEMATAPQSHKALQVRQYIEGLEKGQVHKVVACYQSLCDLTHPGASSVWMWLTSENGVDLELNPNQDESTIAYYLTEYRDTFLELLMFAFNPAVLTLSVLNYFPLRTFHTPALLDWNLSGIPLWQKCQSKLGNVLPLARKGLKSVKPNPAVHTDAAR
jgi:hypothetical protein